MARTSLEALKARKLAAMSAAERETFDAAYVSVRDLDDAQNTDESVDRDATES